MPTASAPFPRDPLALRTRAEALALLAAEDHRMEPGQKYEVDVFRPGDAWGVARIHHAVYGADYHVDMPYVPELLLRAVAAEDIMPAVVRTPSGDLAAYSALFRSTPPNPNLYEYGQTMVHPEYRNSRAVLLVFKKLIEMAEASPLVHGFFGEAVCHHLVTQKMGQRSGCVEVALEPSLLPEGAYAREGIAGRVSCLIMCRMKEDRPQVLYWPARFQRRRAFLADALGLDRDIRPSEAGFPEGSASRVQVQRFEAAGVVRMNVRESGADLAARLAEAEAGSPALVQVYLNLAEPWAGAAADLLAGAGYFLGGYLPIWLGPDALLMQKLAVPPGFGGMLFAGDRGRELADLVREEWEGATRG